MKIILIALALLTSSCFAAEKPATSTTNSCSFTKESLKFSALKDPAIINSYWQHTQDPETEEFVDRLFIAYRNGDSAVIEHKYCLIYNFKASYYSTAGEHTQSIEKLDQLLFNLQDLNALATKLSVIPNKKIIAELKKLTFNPEKPSRVNFNAADKEAVNDVTYSFSYDPLGSLGMLGSMVSLYVAYGSN
ncbi:MAG: hypothetical protein V4660_14335 [Pseudomonadota bacterium]